MSDRSDPFRATLPSRIVIADVPMGGGQGALEIVEDDLRYGACPDLEDRAKIAELLRPGRIGVELSEEFQLHPEQSTTAIIVHHLEAKYLTT